MSLHPWNRVLWQRLTANREQLPHALLLHGPAGLGKRALALDLAQWLLCQAPAPEGACGECTACLWFVQGGHPDFRLIEPAADAAEAAGEAGKKGGRSITVEQVREVVEFLALSTHQGGWRAVVLSPAESLGVAAANALLKTLEEPPPRTAFLLVAHQPRRLLPTILSRCRKLPVAIPEAPVARDWLLGRGVTDPEVLLAEAGGAPLLALENADPERLARRERFVAALARPERVELSLLAADYQQRLGEAWGWLVRWLCDLILWRSSGEVRYFRDQVTDIRNCAGRLDWPGLWQLYKEVQSAGRWLQHPLNSQLLLESWLIRYVDLVEVKR